MGGVAEVEIIVAWACGRVVGARHHRLRFERFERRGWRHFGGDDGCHGDFPIHGDHRDQFVVARPDGESSVELALDPAWNAQPEIRRRSIASRDAHGRRNSGEVDGVRVVAFEKDFGMIRCYEQGGGRRRDAEFRGVEESEYSDLHGSSGSAQCNEEQRVAQARTSECATRISALRIPPDFSARPGRFCSRHAVDSHQQVESRCIGRIERDHVSVARLSRFVAHGAVPVFTKAPGPTPRPVPDCADIAMPDRISRTPGSPIARSIPSTRGRSPGAKSAIQFPGRSMYRRRDRRARASRSAPLTIRSALRIHVRRQIQKICIARVGDRGADIHAAVTLRQASNGRPFHGM